MSDNIRIDKVEVYVTSNEGPADIARAVVRYMDELPLRRPTPPVAGRASLLLPPRPPFLREEFTLRRSQGGGVELSREEAGWTVKALGAWLASGAAKEEPVAEEGVAVGQLWLRERDAENPHIQAGLCVVVEPSGVTGREWKMRRCLDGMILYMRDDARAVGNWTRHHASPPASAPVAEVAVGPVALGQHWYFAGCEPGMYVVSGKVSDGVRWMARRFTDGFIVFMDAHPGHGWTRYEAVLR